MEEKKLIEMIRNKDEEAYSSLLEKYESMIHSLVNGHNLIYGDFKISRDDLYQEGCLGLLDACRTYRFESDAQFSSFAYVVIKRRINRAFKKMVVPYVNEVYSYDKLDQSDRIDEITNNRVEENPLAYVRQKQKEADMKEKMGKLNAMDREILKLRLSGLSYSDIAKRLDITSKHVDNRIYRLRKKYLHSDWSKKDI